MAENSPKIVEGVPQKNVQEGEPQIELRVFTATDASEYFRLFDQNRKYFANFGNLEENKYENVQKVEQALSNPGNKIRYGIYIDKILVGTINLTPQEDTESAKIGALVAKTFSGQGIATKALLELSQLKKNEFEFFIADAHVDNIGSNRVLDKAGFEFIEKKGDKNYYQKNLKE